MGEEFVVEGLGVLRVLLVESDDSTRQIIAALLRKCNFKVSAVSDGLKAWQILKGKHHDIDLILTEVELPYISGFALLTSVMEHDVCKNIPVIMMSSHHSISMVLKCTLKGASDFLIKPVRKNELRNLWQHVWRRQTLTGGYIPPNVTITQQKVVADTDKCTASNHSSDCVVLSCIEKNRSEKGSDAQSSIRMPFTGAENTYGQNTQGLPQPKCKITSNLSNPDTEKQEDSAKLSQESTVQESETTENRSNFGSNVAGPYNEPYKLKALRLREEHDYGEGTNPYQSVGSESAENGNIGSEGSGNRQETNEPMKGAIDFIGTFDDLPVCSHVHSGGTDGNSNEFGCIPPLELSLRRLCPGSFKDYKTDERRALDCSNASAISWYSNSRTPHSLFPTVAGTCAKSEEGRDQTHGTSQRGATLCDNEENTTIGCTKSGFWSPSLDANTKINSMKQDYQRSDETRNNCSIHTVGEGKSLETMEESRNDGTSQSCSSSLCDGVAPQLSSNMYGGVCIRSENSNDGGQDGLRGTGGLGSSEREAALAKFRMKRKERCYDKKVRYESRKRVAEQRPRVKGQFVRQVQTAMTGADGLL